MLLLSLFLLLPLLSLSSFSPIRIKVVHDTHTTDTQTYI